MTFICGNSKCLSSVKFCLRLRLDDKGECCSECSHDDVLKAELELFLKQLEDDLVECKATAGNVDYMAGLARRERARLENEKIRVERLKAKLK